jgi:hypothetical protein
MRPVGPSVDSWQRRRLGSHSFSIWTRVRTSGHLSLPPPLPPSLGLCLVLPPGILVPFSSIPLFPPSSYLHSHLPQPCSQCRDPTHRGESHCSRTNVRETGSGRSPRIASVPDTRPHRSLGVEILLQFCCENVAFVLQNCCNLFCDNYIAPLSVYSGTRHCSVLQTCRDCVPTMLMLCCNNVAIVFPSHLC